MPYFIVTFSFASPLAMAYFLAATLPETIDLGFVQLGWFKVLILGIVQGALVPPYGKATSIVYSELDCISHS